MTCRRYRQTGGAVLLALALAASVSCSSKTTRQGAGSSYLVIDQLEAAPGVKPEELSNVLQSDVLTYVKKQMAGGTVYVPTIFEDSGVLTCHVAMKNPGSLDSPTEPSPANYVTINRYHVTFVRSDGRSTQGVDVPYAFDGAATGTIRGASSGITFSLVRAQAKMEAPLKALVNGGGSVMLSTIAQVTFYGQDQAGNAVSVSGQISVNFGDWGDPD